ncbi:hypothetical protein HMPREF9056_02689 [Actinomyces sp. oral taxon 170 str. F0386]|nr:hypothetical protein HMPREF9056_02689 [Actinomyces sp. oral taxon 170 str. F0386]
MTTGSAPDILRSRPSKCLSIGEPPYDYNRNRLRINQLGESSQSGQPSQRSWG